MSSHILTNGTVNDWDYGVKVQCAISADEVLQHTDDSSDRSLILQCDVVAGVGFLTTLRPAAVQSEDSCQCSGAKWTVSRKIPSSALQGFFVERAIASLLVVTLGEEAPPDAEEAIDSPQAGRQTGRRGSCTLGDLAALQFAPRVVVRDPGYGVLQSADVER